MEPSPYMTSSFDILKNERKKYIKRKKLCKDSLREITVPKHWITTGDRVCMQVSADLIKMIKL
jgi:hypothetical protein